MRGRLGDSPFKFDGGITQPPTTLYSSWLDFTHVLFQSASINERKVPLSELDTNKHQQQIKGHSRLLKITYPEKKNNCQSKQKQKQNKTKM